VGKDGEFYFENLPAGKHPAHLSFTGGECDFYLSIPEDSEIMIDLGEIICETH
jgi:outer membrane usher protein